MKNKINELLAKEISKGGLRNEENLKLITHSLDFSRDDLKLLKENLSRQTYLDILCKVLNGKYISLYNLDPNFNGYFLASEFRYISNRFNFVNDFRRIIIDYREKLKKDEKDMYLNNVQWFKDAINYDSKFILLIDLIFEGSFIEDIKENNISIYNEIYSLVLKSIDNISENDNNSYFLPRIEFIFRHFPNILTEIKNNIFISSLTSVSNDLLNKMDSIYYKKIMWIYLDSKNPIFWIAELLERLNDIDNYIRIIEILSERYTFQELSIVIERLSDHNKERLFYYILKSVPDRLQIIELSDKYVELYLDNIDNSKTNKFYIDSIKMIADDTKHKISNELILRLWKEHKETVLDVATNISNFSCYFLDKEFKSLNYNIKKFLEVNLSIIKGDYRFYMDDILMSLNNNLGKWNRDDLYSSIIEFDIMLNKNNSYNREEFLKTGLIEFMIKKAVNEDILYSINDTNYEILNIKYSSLTELEKFIYFINLLNSYNLISDYMLDNILKYEKNNFIKKFIMKYNLQK